MIGWHLPELAAEGIRNWSAYVARCKQGIRGWRWAALIPPHLISAWAPLLLSANPKITEFIKLIPSMECQLIHLARFSRTVPSKWRQVSSGHCPRLAPLWKKYRFSIFDIAGEKGGSQDTSGNHEAQHCVRGKGNLITCLAAMQLSTVSERYLLIDTIELNDCCCAATLLISIYCIILWHQSASLLIQQRREASIEIM